MFRNTFSNRNTLIIYFNIFLLLLCFSLAAQEKVENEKVFSGDKKYTLYTAVSGDSPFSIARKFGITLEELNSENPEIRDNLKAGQTIKIPVSISNNRQQKLSGLQSDEPEDRHFKYYSVRKRETVFSIAQKNNVTSEDIYYYNPPSRDGIRVGDVLKIPEPQTSDKEYLAMNKETQQSVRHVVGRRETLYAIAKRYNTTQEEILKLNPAVKGILSKGTILIIPKPLINAEDRDKPYETLKFSEYRIINGDNYYQLEKRFGVSKSELEKLNPKLKDGFNSGMIIIIPLRNPVNNENSTVTDNQTAISNKQLNDLYGNSAGVSSANLNKTYNIGVFLPFCKNLNDSVRIAQRTAGFLEFYSGLLLAADKMTEAGMKLKLFVYDTYQENKEIEKLVKKPEFLSLDLIIGPVYPENQKIVAELSAKNHLPMVSPLSSDSRFVNTTPGYYQINPAKKLRLLSTVDYIADQFANQNIIVLNHSTNSGDDKVIIEKLIQKLGEAKVHRYNIWADDVASLQELLKPESDNIIVMSEGNEAIVSVALTRLNTFSKSNKITVIGLQEYTKMQSINIEYLHNTRFHYLAPYFIDYGSPGVKSFIIKYRSQYGSEPTHYSFQGYDIALHFIGSLRKTGKNFPVSNSAPEVSLLQTDYNFKKLSEFGGYMNHTFYIIEYTDSYEVRSAGKILGATFTDIGGRKETGKGTLDQ